MNTSTMLATLAALGIAAPRLAAQDAHSACEPIIVASRTDFPHHAQVSRLHGVVQLAIQLDSDGKVVKARVTESSGHASLDRAAEKSALIYWRFGFEDCSPAELAQSRVVTVTYRRPPGLTLSGTLNRKALANMRHLRSNPDCHAARPTRGTEIFACHKPTAFDVANARP